MLYDPEYVGYILREWVPVPTGDFQDLPSWRELVIETALTLRRHHAQPLIVPMSLLNDDYAGVLRQRITERIIHPDYQERDHATHEFCLRNLDYGTAAAARRPAETLVLHSDKFTPAELADKIQAHLRPKL